MPDQDTLLRELSDLRERVAIIEDRAAIERLQYQYGFYIDNRMMSEMADLFTDHEPSIEISRRGTYIGKERIRRFLHDVLAQGRWGLMKDEIIHHIQLQQLITVMPDRRTARMRSRALVQGNSPPGSGKMLMAEGTYENEYVREGGVWRIKRIWWVPNYYFEVAGFDKAVFFSGPESVDFPPDRPSVAPDPGLGRGFAPFHYPHPFTGQIIPSPSTKGRDHIPTAPQEQGAT